MGVNVAAHTCHVFLGSDPPPGFCRNQLTSRGVSKCFNWNRVSSLMKRTLEF